MERLNAASSLEGPNTDGTGVRENRGLDDEKKPEK